MENKTFRPFVNVDKDFHVVETSGKAYKQIKLLTMNSPSLKKLEKLAIAKEFKLCENTIEAYEQYYKKELEPNELSSEQYYEQLCAVLFIEKQEKISFDDINLGEMNRAVESFFQKLNAS